MEDWFDSHTELDEPNVMSVMEFDRRLVFLVTQIISRRREHGSEGVWVDAINIESGKSSHFFISCCKETLWRYVI